MAKKIYAIKEGFDSKLNQRVENKIVRTWTECLTYVKGVKGAKYKSFESLEEAKLYLNDTNKLLKKGRDTYPEDCLHVYVDGSYNSSSQKYSYGVVAVRNNIVEYIENGASNDTSKSNIRQIAGELEGAIKGVKYALSKGDKKIVLFHDYEGIFHHATGSWDRKDTSSQQYYEEMKKLMNEGIEVIFVKVDSHTGELFNELADEKCKEALGITSDKIVDKWLNKNNIFVNNHKIKESILQVAPGKGDNIIINNEDNESEELAQNKSDKVILDINNILKKLTIEKQLDVLNYVKCIHKEN